MVPDDLVALYQQYKSDTDAIAAWLATTAVANGYPPNKLPRAVTNDSSLESIGGKGNKDAANKKRQASHQITIEDFTTLSEYIASKRVQVPTTFKSTLDRLIIARTGFRAKLAKQSSSGRTNKSSDHNHSFFLSKLEQIREILRPLYCLPGKAATEPFTDSDEEIVANRFAGLNVEEPTDGSLSDAEIAIPIIRTNRVDGKKTGSGHQSRWR